MGSGSGRIDHGGALTAPCILLINPNHYFNEELKCRTLDTSFRPSGAFSRPSSCSSFVKEWHYAKTRYHSALSNVDAVLTNLRYVLRIPKGLPCNPKEDICLQLSAFQTYNSELLGARFDVFDLRGFYFPSLTSKVLSSRKSVFFARYANCDSLSNLGGLQGILRVLVFARSCGTRLPI